MKKPTYIKIKKILCVISFMLPLFFLMSCSSEIINNKDTGDIVLTDKKYAYIDGTYVAFYTYYNDEGNAYAMKITVENGLINTVNFDMFDYALNAYSQTAPTTQRAHFSSSVTTLCASLMQNQTFKANTSESDKVAYAFMLLAKACTNSASTGDTTPIAVYEDSSVYNSSIPSLHYNAVSSLSVKYQNGALSQITFSQSSAEGSRISAYPSRLDEVVYDYVVSYSDMVNFFNTLPEDGATLYKATCPPAGELFLDDYNTLCSIILSKRVVFSADVYSLFSNR